ncbi:reverse transcriptase domain-containing protein [Tanacetum coccineum]
MRQPRNDKKTFQRSQDDKNGKSDRKCFRCGDPNHLIGECPKPPKDKKPNRLLSGLYGACDSGEEDDEKVKDEMCLVAHASSEAKTDGPDDTLAKGENNGTKLINDPFKSWAEELGIKLVSTLVYHPQANGAVERANRSIIQGIKTRLHKEGGTWVEELPNVLWAHRTTPKTSNGETPFSLAYGTEAVIPTKIGIPTRRVIKESDEWNEEALGLNLNLLEERREIAAIRETRQK